MVCEPEAELPDAAVPPEEPEAELPELPEEELPPPEPLLTGVPSGL